MNTREKRIYKVTLIGTAVNALLVIVKLLAGFFGKSSALVADAVHSLSDFISDIIVVAFVRISGKPKDEGHEYGHGKYETFASMIIGLLLILAGISIFYDGAKRIIEAINGTELPRPSWIALVVAIISIVSKEWLYVYTIKCGKKLDSKVVVANAWHHRSDAYSSLGTLVGISGAMFLGTQWRILDPIAAIIVSIFIIQSGMAIIKPSIRELLDGALPPEEENRLKKIINDVPGIYHIHHLRTRRVGNVIAVECHAKMDGDIPLRKAHEIASVAENNIKEKYGPQTLITIHMEPLPDKSEKR